MLGQTFSHYHVLDKLGEGATAVVYKAEDLALGRAVALKFLPKELSTSNAGSTRFEHEARTASSLNHPNICTIYEIGEHDSCKFLSMELLEGQTLTRVVATGPIEVGRLIELGIQIAEGLDAAHAAQIVHRDIKPANIFVSSRDHIKILDFGVAVLVPRSTSTLVRPAPRPTAVAGTIPYMSPEQLRGDDLDARSDLFALGVVLYEMATGRRPFYGRTSAEQIEIMTNRPPPSAREMRPDLPVELDRIITKALEQDRRLRFQSASDLRADLQRLKRDADARTTVSAGQHIPHAGAQASGLELAIASEKGRGRLMGTVAGGVIVGVLAVAGLVALRQSPPPRTNPAPLAAAPAAPMSKPAAAPSMAGAGAAAVSPSNGPAASPVVARNGSQELKLARSEMALKLYDQAITTLRGLVAAPDSDNSAATAAYFLIASIQRTQGKIEDAMATYLEIAHRYQGKPRAAEALFRLGEVTLQTKRKGKEADATQAFDNVANQYAKTPWAARALMARAELERQRQAVEFDARLHANVPSALITYRRVATDYAVYRESETALWKLGQLYERVKRYDLAARTFRELGMRYPKTQHDAWFRAAELYDHRLKDSATARAAYSRVPRSSAHFDEAQKRIQEFSTDTGAETNPRMVKLGRQ
jgi:TolA-binding protein/tRNA A-37 threonylcarbamoyl transferase component Bud32